MRSINLAAAKAHLSELVEEAAAGNPVCIMRRGKPIAKLVSIAPEKEPLDLAGLRALRATMPMQSESAGDFIRRMRDEDRY